ncbi:hypothetical protein EON63_06260 [archaeon]|nr:MAG: hypothetical protein EON63_06260 [archaeon]
MIVWCVINCVQFFVYGVWRMAYDDKCYFLTLALYLISLSRYATWFLGRIENTLDNEGFAVGNKLSLGDVLLFYVLGEVLDPAQSPDLPQFRREPWGSLEKVNELLARYGV